jgi:plasmid stability protein
MVDVKQMITRLDDELHARLKAKALAEGRSVNDLVTEVLKAAVNPPESAQEWHQRLVAEGKLIAFKSEGEAPGHDEIEHLSRGWGTAVSEALDRTRGEW